MEVALEVAPDALDDAACGKAVAVGVFRRRHRLVCLRIREQPHGMVHDGIRVRAGEERGPRLDALWPLGGVAHH